jgi:hypothetical protein
VVRVLALPALGYDAPSATYPRNVEVLAGAGDIASRLTLAALGAVQTPLLFVLVIVLLRLALRKPWIAMVPTALLLALPFMAESGTTNTLLVLVPSILAGSLLTWTLARKGLLTLVIAWFVMTALSAMPFVADVSSWAASAGNWTLAVLAALTVFGYYCARAGQPLFGRILQD